MAYLISSSSGNMTDGEGGAISLPSVSSYYATSNITQLSNVSTMSMSFWASRTAAGDTVVCGKAGATGNSWYLDVDNALVTVHFSKGGTNSYGTVSITNDTSLHHYVFTYNGGGSTNADKLKCYIDGVQQTLTFTGTIPTTSTTNTGGFNLGRAVYTATIGTTGSTFDQVDLFTTELSSGDISTLYNSGSGLKDASGISGHLVGWQLDEGAGSLVRSYGSVYYDGTATGSPTRVTGLIYNNTSRRFASVVTAATLDSESVSTAVTTSSLDSSTFAIATGTTVDAIAVRVATVATSPTGTITFTLRNSTDSTDVKSTTINVSDLSAQTQSTTSQGWAVIKFPSSYAGVTGKNYVIRVSSSSSSQVNLYASSANNWSRLVRTTSLANPVVADQLVIAGELTGAGTGNDITITADRLDDKEHGSSSGTVTSVNISYRGKLAFPTSGGKSYKFGAVGLLWVEAGGTLEMGTTSSKVASGTTASIPFYVGTNVDSGLIVRNGGIFRTGAASKTRLTSLTADAASSATSITVDDATGWAIGDTIAISSTTRTYSQAESRTITNISGTTITLSSGLTNAHAGTNEVAAKVINISENVKIYGRSASLCAYITINNYPADIEADFFETYYVGSATSTKEGVYWAHIGTSGNVAILKYSVHNIHSSGSSFVNSSTCDNSLWQIISYGSPSTIVITATSGANNNFIGDSVTMLSSGAGFQISDANIGGGNLYALSCNGIGVQIQESHVSSDRTIDLIYSASNAGNGFFINSTRNITIGSLYCIRNTGVGTQLTSCYSIMINNLYMIGNTTSNLSLSSSSSDITINNGYSNGDTTFSTTNFAIINTASAPSSLTINNFSSSSVTGIRTAHTNDFNLLSTSTHVKLALNNCLLGGTNEFSSLAGLAADSMITSQNHDQTANSHKYWVQGGIGTSDTSIYKTSSPSERITPSTTARYIKSSPKICAVDGSSTKTISVWVRCSASGDGATYNGAYPQLILRLNPSLGTNFLSDVVLDTATSSSNGAWEELTATTSSTTNPGAMEFYVRCNGTTGWINVDDWSVT